MKEVFVHHDPTVVGFKKSLLDAASIDSFIRNENTSATFGAGAFGSVQSPVFDPVLCIIDDQRYDEAMSLLKAATEAPASTGADWLCPKCGESVPTNFDACWNCSSTKPQIEKGIQ
jgi:hypothetical protein